MMPCQLWINLRIHNRHEQSCSIITLITILPVLSSARFCSRWGAKRLYLGHEGTLTRIVALNRIDMILVGHNITGTCSDGDDGVEIQVAERFDGIGIVMAVGNAVAYADGDRVGSKSACSDSRGQHQG